MSTDIKNVVASVKSRLQNVARKTGRPFDEILRLYGIERFLYRLSLTPYGRSFVLKGGLIFLALDVPVRRLTRDIDLRGFTQNSLENIRQIFVVVSQQPVEDDGIIFRSDTITAEIEQFDADYRGIRVSFLGMLGKAEIPMQVDIGFTDDITPAPKIISYPTILNMHSPQLYGYPPESVISEKFHAIVHLGEVNSRMKDYYDIWLLSDCFDFDGSIIKSAISRTFNRRGTIVPRDMPLGLSPAFAVAHGQDWKIFLRRMGIENHKLDNFSLVLQQLRTFLLPPMESIALGNEFSYHWRAGKAWD